MKSSLKVKATTIVQFRLAGRARAYLRFPFGQSLVNVVLRYLEVTMLCAAHD
jgi:hypothetical protein